MRPQIDFFLSVHVQFIRHETTDSTDCLTQLANLHDWLKKHAMNQLCPQFPKIQGELLIYHLVGERGLKPECFLASFYSIMSFGKFATQNEQWIELLLLFRVKTDYW